MQQYRYAESYALRVGDAVRPNNNNISKCQKQFAEGRIASECVRLPRANSAQCTYA